MSLRFNVKNLPQLRAVFVSVFVAGVVHAEVPHSPMCPGQSLSEVLVRYADQVHLQAEEAYRNRLFIPLSEGHPRVAASLLEDWELEGRLMHLSANDGVAEQLRQSMARLARLIPSLDSRAFETQRFTDFVWRDPPVEIQAAMRDLRFFAGAGASTRMTLRQRLFLAELQYVGRYRGLSRQQMVRMLDDGLYGSALASHPHNPSPRSIPPPLPPARQTRRE